MSNKTFMRKRNKFVKLSFLILMLIITILGTISVAFAGTISSNSSDLDAKSDNRIKAFNVTNDKVYSLTFVKKDLHRSTTLTGGKFALYRECKDPKKNPHVIWLYDKSIGESADDVSGDNVVYKGNFSMDSSRAEIEKIENDIIELKKQYGDTLTIVTGASLVWVDSYGIFTIGGKLGLFNYDGLPLDEKALKIPVYNIEGIGSRNDEDFKTYRNKLSDEELMEPSICDANKIGESSADSNGKIKFTDLKGTGTLVGLKELEAPDGYMLNSKITTAKLGDPKSGNNIDVYNQKLYNLEFIKKSSVSNNIVTGGKFQLYDGNGDKVGSLQELNSEGKLIYSDLKPGKYHLEEQEAPVDNVNGIKYQINTKGWDVEISKDETKETVFEKITNEPYARLKFRKIDKYTHDIPSQTILSSFKFRLRENDKDGKIVADNIALDFNGEFQINNVPSGKYHLEEISCPSGYELDTKGWDVTANSSEPNPIVTNLENSRLYNLQIKKSDSDGQEVTNGGKFQLYDKDNQKIGNEKSLAEGTLYYSELPEGNYHLEEVEAPSGTIKNEKGWDITVSEEKAILSNGKLVVTKNIHNDKNENLRYIFIQKSDEYSGDAITGGQFSWVQATATETGEDVVYRGTQWDAEKDILVPDNKGQIKIQINNDGWYFLSEEEAPAGYIQNKMGWLVKIEDKNFYIGSIIDVVGNVSKMKEYNVANGDDKVSDLTPANIGIITNKAETQFRIAKTDEDGNPVKGVKFDFIADSDTETDFHVATDSKGYANISQLKDGVSYAMRESETPVPYIKNSSEWTILYDKENGSVTITDKSGKQTVYDITKDESVKTYSVKNSKLPDFVKQDALTGNAITGAEFALLTEDQYASYSANGELPEEESSDKTYSVTVNTDPYTRYEYDEDTGTGKDVFVSGEYTGDGEYKKGDTVNVTYKAYSGHSIQKIYLDGKDVTDKYPNGITFNKINQNHIIRLVFDDAAEPDNTYESDAEDVQDYTEPYIHGKSVSDGTIRFYNNSDTGEKDAEVKEGTYYLVETKAADGYDASSFTAKKLIVSSNESSETEIHVSDTDGTELKKIGGKYILKNAKYGNVSLLKTDAAGNSLEGAEFKLEGLSAAGDRINMVASSSQTYKSDDGTIDDTPASEKENDKTTVDKKTGIVNFGHVPEGYSYVLTETKAPNGKLNSNGTLDTKSYALDDNLRYFVQVITTDNTKVRNPVTQNLVTLNKGTYFYDSKGDTVSLNSDNQLVIKNDASVSLGIQKSSSNGNVALNGAVFTLEGTSDAGDKINIEKETGTDASKPGFARFDGLEDGTYSLTETKIPDGYEKNPEKYTVVVSGSNIKVTDSRGTELTGTDYYAIGVKTFDITNDELSEFGIKKVDENGKTLVSAKFKLTGTSNAGEKVSQEVTVNNNGYAEFTKLPKGTYSLKETEAPYEYGLGCREWEVTVNPVHTVVSGTDKETSKGDYTKEDGISVKSEGGVTIKEKTTGKKLTGTMRSQNSKTVKDDQYYLKSGNDYLEDNEEYVSTNASFELTKGKNAVSPEYITYTISDESGKILNDQNSGLNSNSPKIDLSSLGLKKGKTYYITASFYEDASRTNMKSVSVMLRYTDDQSEQTQVKPSDFDITNLPRSVKLKIVKKDAITEKPIHGVKFEVWSSNKKNSYAELLKSGTTDANGEIDFGEVQDEMSYIYETSTPSGYKPISNVYWIVYGNNNYTFSLLKNADTGDTIRNMDDTFKYEYSFDKETGQPNGTLTIYNEPTSVRLPLPFAGGRGIVTIILIALVCILGSLEYRIVQKKKKRGNSKE